MSSARKGNCRVLSREIRILQWRDSRRIALSIILTQLGPLSVFSSQFRTIVLPSNWKSRCVFVVDATCVCSSCTLQTKSRYRSCMFSSPTWLRAMHSRVYDIFAMCIVTISKLQLQLVTEEAALIRSKLCGL